MATWDDVRRIVTSFPGVDERLSRGVPQWRTKHGLVAWERPLMRPDLAALGDRAPDDTPLGVRVPDLGVKEALLAEDGDTYFTTPHFDGYPIVLVRVEELDSDELEELLTEAWLARAPKRLAREFLDEGR